MFWRRKREPTREERLIEMLESLILLGRDWEKSKHTWFHPSGVCIWVGNQDYGLGVILDAESRHDYATASQDKPGSVKLSDGSRKRLWKAIVDSGTAAGEGEARILAVTSRIQAMYAPNVIPFPAQGTSAGTAKTRSG